MPENRKTGVYLVLRPATDQGERKMPKARCLRWLIVFGMMVLGGTFALLTPPPATAASLTCRYAPQQIIVMGTEADIEVLPDTWERIGAIELTTETSRRVIIGYALPATITVEEALEIVSRYPRLSADPNCYIGASGWSIVGSGGWAPLPGVPAGNFPGQPAFDSATGGISLYSPHGRTLSETGKAITIGFIDGVDSSAIGGSGATYTASFPSPLGAYTVAVSDLTVTLPLSFTVASTTTLPYMGSHGPFALSLAHEIAPDATYRLYGVLNQNGVGTLFGGLSAMNDFMNDPNVVANQAVLNLSWEVAGAKVTLNTLATMIQALIDDGIVVVAAAGNGSAGTTPQPTGTPANLTGVIPVGATNGADMASCYSNQSWFKAPGGDGVGSGCTTPTFTQCGTTPISCIVGYDPTSPTDYSYWAGTSYSTAFVSGTAALMLEVDPTLTPATLHTVVNQSIASLGPILDVPALVNEVR
jgi:hypothetical protein